MSSTKLFERPDSGDRALLVYTDLNDRYVTVASSDQSEFKELATSAGVEVLDMVCSNRSVPDSRYFIGSGKVEELREQVLRQHANLVLFSHDISPSQERNLEKALSCRVYGRTTLILDIFAQRARTFEGKLQVELAQLKYMSTRLVRGWTHLERQKGGIGLRGPGETQLETDRRLLGLRIKQLQKRLLKVAQRRELGRKSRRKFEVPTVALVGYTNAGKSTLFNQITGSDVYVENKLFATLDPTLRQVHIPTVGPIVLADTVGFVRKLPHDLVAAFKSTLLETREADLLIHVVDINDENRMDTVEQVNSVLREVKADHIPQVLVFNKIDLSGKAPQIVYDESGRIVTLYVSAKSGQGIDLLSAALQQLFQQDQAIGWIKLCVDEGSLRSKLYQQAQIYSEAVDAQGNFVLHLSISKRNLARMGVPPTRVVTEHCATSCNSAANLQLRSSV